MGYTYCEVSLRQGSYFFPSLSMKKCTFTHLSPLLTCYNTTAAHAAQSSINVTYTLSQKLPGSLVRETIIVPKMHNQY